MRIGARLSRVFLSKLKFAYKNNLISVTHFDVYSESSLRFFAKLQSWGLISHYEVRSVRSANILGPKGRSRHSASIQVRAYLRYFDKKPAVCFWTFNAAGQASHVLSYDHLHRLAWYQPGVFFCLKYQVWLFITTSMLSAKVWWYVVPWR